MRFDALAQRLRPLAALALLLAVFSLAVMATGNAQLEPADFVFNNGAEVETLDPASVTGVPEGRIIRCLFEGLVVTHPKTLEPLPGVAKSWDISVDGLVYTFHLRQNAKWSDGEVMTAHDFVWSYERFLNPMTASKYAYQLWYVKGAKAYTTEVDADGNTKNDFSSVGITAPDDWTLRIELNDPTAFFLELMAFYPQFPVSRRCIEQAQRDFPNSWKQEWVKPKHLVGNGPYTVEFRRINDRIRLRKNPHYWDRDNVAFETMDALAVEQYTTMLNMYLTGVVHWIDRIAAGAVNEMLPREDFCPGPYLGTYFFRVNTNKAPFDDKRVRRALALTIPRQEICQNVTKAGQVPAYSLVPPGMAGYTVAEMTRDEDPAANAEEARRLLAEAGYGPKGKPFPIIEVHYNTSETHATIALVIADAWSRELGIRAKLLNQEWKVYLDTQSTINYDVSRSAWIGDYADPNTFVDLFVTGGDNNKTGWGNPEYDRFVTEANRELDPVKRMALLRQAEQIFVEELPSLPVYYYVSEDSYSPRLGGYFKNLKQEHFPKFWYWMDDEELAAKRASYEGTPGRDRVRATGPREGLYSPNQIAARARGTAGEAED